MLPIPEVKGHPINQVAAYADLLTASPTFHPNEPLLTIGSGKSKTVVTLPMLANGLRTMLDALCLDTSLCSLHSL